MNKDSWEILKLGEICEIISGSTPKTNINEYWNGKYNWVTPAELNDELDTIYDTQRKITAKAIKETNLKLLPKGAILLSSRAPIGKVAIAGNDMYSNQGFKNLICSKKIYNRYLFRFLKGKTEYLNSLGRGATFKEISKEIVSNIPIPIPPISLQEQIVKELDILSDIITKKKEQLTELDKLAQATFYDMFGDPVENEKGWDIRGLEKICTQIVDCPHSTPIKSETKTLYPCIRTSELKNGSINWDSMQYVEQEEYLKRTKRLTPKAGDIIYGREGSYGDAVCLPNTGHNFCLGQRTMLFRPNSQILNSTYLLKFIISDYVYSQARNKNAGSTVGHVNVSDIKKFNILCPPLSLQNQFAEKIEAIEQQKALINQSITDTQLLFDYTMDKYFN